MCFSSVRRCIVTTATLTLLTALNSNAQAQINLYFTDSGATVGQGSIKRVVSDGVTQTVSTFLDGFRTPIGLTTGPDGNLYVADPTTGQIDEVDLTTFTRIKPLTGSAINPYGIAFNSSGQLFYSDSVDNRIYRLNGDGTSTIYSQGNTLNDPTGLTFGQDDKLYVANGANGNNTISVVNTDGSNAVYATGLSDPNDVKFGPDGALYAGSVAQPDGSGSNNRIFRITNGGATVAVYSQGNALAAAESLVFDANGNLYASNLDNNSISITKPNGVTVANPFGNGSGTSSLFVNNNTSTSPIFVTIGTAPRVVASPEPSTFALALVGAGAVGLLGVVRRRRA